MINFRDILGGLLVVGFMGATGLLFWRTIPSENEQLIAYMLGQLSGFVGGVVALHYAAKAGEKELDAQRTDNTTKALDAIIGAQGTPAHGLNDPERPAGTPNDPVHTTVEP